MADLRAWVVFDSTWGNTEPVARWIAESVGGEIRVSRASAAAAAQASAVELLIVGSPTIAGRPTEAVQRFLRAIRPASLEHVRCACFDTRVSMKFARVFGCAADKIATGLTVKGGRPAAAPEGFIVRGKQGPLAEDELRRAADWARSLARQD